MINDYDEKFLTEVFFEEPEIKHIVDIITSKATRAGFEVEDESDKEIIMWSAYFGLHLFPAKRPGVLASRVTFNMSPSDELSEVGDFSELAREVDFLKDVERLANSKFLFDKD